MDEELKESLSLIIFIQMRIYDALTLLVAANSPEAAKKMQKIHDDMQFINKEPWSE
jgi:hypothetical protein